MNHKIVVASVIIASLFACKSSKEEVTIAHTRRNSAEIEKKVDLLISKMTLDEKVSLCHANSKFAIAGVERLGIKEMWMSDGPHGVREEISRDSWKPAGWTNDFSTYLPPLTAVAASWNPENATKHGMVLGSEARERKKEVILGPGVNMARNPLYGRNFEYMGEDAYLATKLVVPEIIAIQSNDVAACVKHYALNEQEWNRHHVNALPSDRTLRELYLPPFEAAVKEAGVYTFMGAYNQYYGTNCNQSKKLVMDILKGEWGYKGLLMTDWDCDINTYDAAINGLDIEMGTRAKTYDDYFLANPFKEQLKSGKIPMSILDDKVRRILRVQHHIGMMDANRLPGERNTERNRKYAKEIIEQGIVLLKNENQVLPLTKEKIKKVLVMGPNADTPHGHGGGSSQVKSDFEITPLQGIKNYLGENVIVEYFKAEAPKELGLAPIPPDFVITKQSGAGTPAWKRLTYKDQTFKGESKFNWLTMSQLKYKDTDNHYEKMIAEVEPMKTGNHTFILDGQGTVRLIVDNKEIIKTNLTKGNYVKYEINLEKGKKYNVTVEFSGTEFVTLGWEAPGSNYLAKEQYLAKAKEADLVYFVGGLDHGYDKESEDRADMKLPYNQDYTISELLKVQPNTVVLMVAGSAVEMPWFKDAKAVIWGWYGGMYAGEAVTDVLFGKLNPSGKVPITLPNTLEENPHVFYNDYNEKECFYKENIFMGYRWFEEKNIKPLVPFGYGMSYTTFSYSDLKIEAATENNAVQKVTFKITNTGKIKGDEIAQLYLTDLDASVKRAKKDLKGFGRVSLNPGETKEIALYLTKRDLSFWDETSNSWKVESGKFLVQIGENSASIKLKGEFNY